MTAIYEYQATVIRVVDGDTIHANVDLGRDIDVDLGCDVHLRCDVHMKMVIRLARINAPEMKTPEGPPAKAALEALLFIADGAFPVPLTLRTIKDRKEEYGRYLGELVINGANVNDAMVSGGHAVYVKY